MRRLRFSHAVDLGILELRRGCLYKVLRECARVNGSGIGSHYTEGEKARWCATVCYCATTSRE